MVRSLAAALALTAIAGGTIGCATGGGREPAPVVVEVDFAGLEAAERIYLLDPLAGYPRAVSLDAQERLAAAFVGLRRQGDLGRARAVAAELLAAEPGLDPARTLSAAADFVDGRHREVVAALGPVVAELPGYTAAELLFARSAELTDDPVAAFESYLRAAPAAGVAGRRAVELLPRVSEIVANRVQAALAGGRTAEARAELGRLRAWAPDAEPTFVAAAAVAAAAGDRAEELAAVSRLAALRPDDRALAIRAGELEIEVGDPGAGLEIFERLAAAEPGDRELASRLAAAKFRWRLEQLPAQVRRAAAQPELSRGDYAVLLYWLVPSVRYGRPAGGTIASDILDDPRREEIARVVNLGLLEVERGVHRFSPGAPVRRGSVLTSLLRLAAAAAEGGSAAAACAGSEATAPGPTAEAICRAAARCRLTATADDCLAGGPLSGHEALELIRRGLDLLR